MGRITSSVGLVSGIDTGSIITQLIALDSRPVNHLQTKVTTAANQKQAYTDLGTQLNTLKQIGDTLTLPNTFAAATANSSDNNVLTATAAKGASIGSFQFQVARLVTTQQAISQGFTASTGVPVGAGTLTISLGGGDLKTETKLSDLNGGKGISRGAFRITDHNGKSAAIDLGSSVTLDDVANKINSALDISVRATVGNNGLVLKDLTGLVTGSLTVQESGNGTTAHDLGIRGTTATDTLKGASVNSLGLATSLDSLSNGRGVETAINGNADFRVLAGDGSLFDVTLKGAKTIGDVVDAINKAAGGKVRASVPAGAGGIQITDANGGSVTVANLNQSNAAADLGILGSGVGGITGNALIGGVDSALISTLNGGSGIALGKISITDRTGANQTIDLSGARSVSDLLDAINSQVDPGSGTHAINVTASLNASGNGIQLVDNTGGAGSVTVTDAGSTTAATLGIAGTFDSTHAVISGANLHRQFVTANTLLTDYNGGKGVALGKLKITNSQGATGEVDLLSLNATKIGDVLAAINNLNLGVNAAINANGNGIQLTDSALGTGQVKVAEDGSTTATDLNIFGSGTNNKIDGAFEKTITVTATDDLSTVTTKITQLGFGVTASVINDGSTNAPFRLSLNAINSGRNGRFVFDAGTTNLGTTNLVDAQDAAVFIGGQGSANPLLVTSSKNQLTNVINGVTVDLHGTSSSPVTLNIARDSSNISAQLKSFVDGYNSISIKIATLTKFDTTTNKGGLLLGDGTTQTIQQDLAGLLNTVVAGAGKYKILGQLGITIDDKNQLTYDSNKFDAAYGTDPSSIKTLFTRVGTGFGSVLSKTVNKLTDPVSGLITIQNQTLDNNTLAFNNQITQLNSLLDAKKTRLQNQFANMEKILSDLQSQGAALGSLTGLVTTPSTSKASGTRSA